MNTFDYVILGGGIAGLCAAKRLLELGIQPLVIEAGSYPAHKVCGEFLSPSSLNILRKWGLQPIPIYQAQFHTASRHLQMNFQSPAGSLSHLTLDSELAAQLTRQGATLLTQTKVIDLIHAQPGGFHYLSLSSGEKIKAKHLLIATGRLPHSHSPSQSFSPRYKGFKAHFSGVELNSTLYMFSYSGAYLGLTPVENGHANLACLAKIEQVQPFSSSQHFMQHLISSHPLLSQLLAPGQNLFEDWMETNVPEFGLRSTPQWSRTYWIGDAAGTIPPASGNGLSLAITSGYLAAEFAKREDPIGFQQAWRNCCSSPIRWGKGLHRLFLNPSLGSQAIRLSRWFPFLAQQAFDLTRLNKNIPI
jgi:flavin-dependent dehydrogenase